MIARLASACRRTGRIVLERPRSLIWSTLALTCALLAVGVAGLGALSVDQWNDQRPAPRSGLVVYLGEGVTDVRAQELAKQLHALDGVERVELISSAEAAKRLVASLGAGAALLEGVDLQALPASVEVTLAPGVRDVIAMSPIVRELRGTAGVADVVVENPPTAEPRSSAGSVGSIVWVIAGLFAGLAVLTMLAAIRLRLERLSDMRGGREIEVVELLGGRRSFLGAPLAFAGALQAAFAALLAAGLLLAGLHFYGDAIAGAVGGLGRGEIELAQPTFAMLGMFVGGSAALGLVAGGLAGLARTSPSRAPLPPPCGALA